jgi:hypothetical protein
MEASQGQLEHKPAIVPPDSPEPVLESSAPESHHAVAPRSDAEREAEALHHGWSDSFQREGFEYSRIRAEIVVEAPVSLEWSKFMVGDRVNVEEKGFPFVEIAELEQHGKRFLVAVQSSQSSLVSRRLFLLFVMRK